MLLFQVSGIKNKQWCNKNHSNWALAERSELSDAMSWSLRIQVWIRMAYGPISCNWILICRVLLSAHWYRTPGYEARVSFVPSEDDAQHKRNRTHSFDLITNCKYKIIKTRVADGNILEWNVYLPVVSVLSDWNPTHWL